MTMDTCVTCRDNYTRANLLACNEYTKLIYSYYRDLYALPMKIAHVYCAAKGGYVRKHGTSGREHVIFGTPLSRKCRINTDLSHL